MLDISRSVESPVAGKWNVDGEHRWNFDAEVARRETERVVRRRADVVRDDEPIKGRRETKPRPASRAAAAPIPSTGAARCCNLPERTPFVRSSPCSSNKKKTT